ncbi:metalloprotease [Western grey kangaroopox virus]|uniref:Metalloendopeptidase n=1 Tax=Western grey kangaroopox virus TaxID=1566307 RepID=A0A2C9DSL1_9POXV|nr:metalloprotease [Western grey kangaroopox virus]ATI20994.1 metalloprotease [Western grey kangaroopox virus]
MIQLANGVRVFVNTEMNKDIYIGLSNFGFENDIAEELGVAHLLEHILISFDHRRFAANATTSRTYMSFWCRALDPADQAAAVSTAVSWFFGVRGVLKTDFSRAKLRNYIHELENEYYFRNEMFHCMDILTYLGGGDLYNGGRITMMKNIAGIREMLANRMRKLCGPDVVIFIKRLTSPTMAMLRGSFGTLPRFPERISALRIRDVYNKIVMVPSPFYTLMIQVDNVVDNVLAILCLVDNYHFVDYDTIGDKLYLSISFMSESDYEEFINEIDTVDLSISSVDLDHGDDYIMTFYVNFPWFQHDLLDYLYLMNTEHTRLVEALRENLRRSIREKRIIVIYPTFAQSVYNSTDSQDHGLIVLDVDFRRAVAKVSAGIAPGTDEDRAGTPRTRVPRARHRPYRRQRRNREVFLSYGDGTLMRFVSLSAYMSATGRASRLTFQRLPTGIHGKHSFDTEDLDDIFESETFIRYSRSRPATLYQYIFLAYFATGKSIQEIVGQREELLPVNLEVQSGHRLIFGKRSRYDITTRSSFVCGVIKGNLGDKVINEYMWCMKSLGLLYTMDFTKLATRNTYYVFAFTIYADGVFKYLSSAEAVSKFCFVVSSRGRREDYSALHKEVVVNFR